VLDIEHERDIERLRRLALLQKSQLEHLVAVLARKCAELAKLKGGEDELQLTLKLLEDAQKQVAEADALVGGGRSDKGDGGDKGDKQEREAQTGHGPTEQLALERVTLHCELDAADRVCPSCSGELQPLKDQAECSEMIDVVELKYQVVQVERQKYVCKCGSVVETAPGPERAIDGGRYSLRFALKVAFDKYVAHLPLERQARLMAHAGLEVTSQTLWDQCWAATRLLEPVYDALFQKLRTGPVIGVDQTSWPDLEDKSQPPWQMWCLTAPGVVYHRICDDKSAATLQVLARRLPRLGGGGRARHARGRRARVPGNQAGRLLGARASSLPRRRRRLPRGAAHARLDRGRVSDRREGHDQRGAPAAPQGRIARGAPEDA
jgi:transposase